MKKLDNDTIDKRLEGLNIKKIGNVFSGTEKTNFLCLQCNYIWKTSANHILRGRGCAKCAGMVPPTNDEIDQKLIGRNIKRLENIISVNKPISWQCLVENCQYIWKTKANAIVSGHKTGCPKCSKVAPLTNEEVDKRLKGRTVKRIGKVINNQEKIEFLCLIDECGYIWKASPNNVMSGKGCHKCAKQIRLTNEIIDERLLKTNIRRLSDVINAKKRVNFKCLVCEYNWWTSPWAVSNLISGCPSCSKCIELTNEIIDQRIMGRNIKRLDDYIIDNTKLRWLCLNKNCKNIWFGLVSNVVNKESGCPNCSLSKNEKIAAEMLIKSGLIIEKQKIIKNIFKNENSQIKVDFYLPEINTIIEYNGIQHYVPVTFGNMTAEQAKIAFEKQKNRDKYLQKICDNNNINLIWIDGRQYTNSKLKNYILNDLIPILKEHK
jgi:hypothetical protein